MKIPEITLEALRESTVDVLLAIRADHLRTPSANILKHWTRLSDRLRAAARSSSTPEQWCSRLMRDMLIASPSAVSSRSFEALCRLVAQNQCAQEWLDLIESEHGYLIASARVRAEEKRNA